MPCNPRFAAAQVSNFSSTVVEGITGLSKDMVPEETCFSSQTPRSIHHEEYKVRASLTAEEEVLISLETDE